MRARAVSSAPSFSPGPCGVLRSFCHGNSPFLSSFQLQGKLATSREGTMEDLEMEAITAARVANEERLGFCPRHVGMAKILAFEWRIVN